MVTIKEDLQRRLSEVLERGMPTPVPSPLLAVLSHDLVVEVRDWLDHIWAGHSVAIEIIGQHEPLVSRPSLDWLRESLKA